MTADQKAIPFFSQWETPGMTEAVLAEGAAVALRRDPRWRISGARSLEEYVTWASHICGMACLKMILAARTGRLVPTLELARACLTYGGYQVTEDGAIKGLIYAPFVTFIGQEFGLKAQIMTSLTASSLAEVFRHSEFFMASVHPGIRWPDQEPPHKGGHLVLVTAATGKAVTFHNPSGHGPGAQVAVTLPVDTFETFFAGRGIAIHRSDVIRPSPP